MSDTDAVNRLVGSVGNMGIANGKAVCATENAGLKLVLMDNTLRTARLGEGKDLKLFLSLWLRDPAHIANYHELVFVKGKALAGVSERPIPVLVDNCTLQWLDQRQVGYVGTAIRPDLVRPGSDDGPAIQITGIKVGPAPQGANNDLPIEEFVPKFLQGRRKYTPIIPESDIPQLRPAYVE